MIGIWIVSFLLSLIVDLNTTYPRHVCHPGTYLVTARNDLDFCLPCTDGVNFMPDSWHTHRNCYNCTQIRDQDLEILVTECNRTHDAEILCTPGYYRRRARNKREQDRCEKCFECEQPTLACQGYHDTVCCGSPNYDAVKDEYGIYVCQERPVLCGPGHFLHPQTRQCSPCLPGTFMTEDKHDNTACRLCQTLSDLKAHQTILHDCNSTHQTIIGCESGYFIDSPGDLVTNQVKCLPCQKCEHQGRECDHSGITVVDTESDPLCRPADQTNISEQLTRNINGTENQPDADTNDRLTLWLSIGNLILVVCTEITILVICCKQTFQGKTCSVKLMALYVNLALVFVSFLFMSVKTSLLPRNIIAWKLDMTAGIGMLVSTLFIFTFYSFFVYKKETKETVKRLIYRMKGYDIGEIHTDQVDRLRALLPLYEKSSDENNEPSNTETVHMVRQSTPGDNDVQPQSEDNQETSLMIDQDTSGDNDLQPQSEDNQETTLMIDQDTSGDNYLKPESEDNQETSLMIGQDTSGDNYLKPESEDNQETSLMIDQDTSGDNYLKPESEDNQETSLMIGQDTPGVSNQGDV